MRVLWGAVVYEEAPLAPTCYPFIIPKASKKVTLILSYVKVNKQDAADPPTFHLSLWEDLSRALIQVPLGTPLYGLHIDLKNAFWSFRLPAAARQVFRSRPAPGAAPVKQGHLPFGWKYSPTFVKRP